MSETPKPKLLPAPVLRGLEKIGAWLRALPIAARMILFTVAGATMVVGAYYGVHSAYESYTVLFSQMDREDAAAVVAKLKELKIPYRLAAEGTAVEVPDAKVMEVRLELASAGLPRGGGIGFESFDKMRLGATEFEQRVLYKRALEGELARTISSLGAVQSARIHLVTPEKSVFAARIEPASASIVLKLRPGRTLGPSEVSGIVHLTASSVPSLAPEHITLVTTDGTMLHKPRATSGDAVSMGDGDEISPARATENGLEERARAMIERFVGSGHADVRVSAEMDLARVERVEDHYDPSKSVLRSEEESIDRNGGPDNNVAGVPGAESNNPAAPIAPSPLPAALAAADGGAPAIALAGAAAKGALGAGVVRESHTRNFEIDHVSEKRTRTTGGLKRLAVAVVVDGIPLTVGGKTAIVPRGKEELEKISGLVRSAIGIDASRGDILTVESVPFLEADKTAEPAPPPSFVSQLPPPVRKYGIYAGAAVMALLFLVVLGSLRGKSRAEALARSTMALSAAANPSISVLVPAAEVADPRLAAHQRAGEDPATAALVLRAWLGVGEPRLQDAE